MNSPLEARKVRLRGLRVEIPFRQPASAVFA
jgi:hypothetical protein